MDITILYPKYTDINSLHVTQIDLLHNDTFCITFKYTQRSFFTSETSELKFTRFRCKKGSLRVISDDFSGCVDTCGTGKRNRARALVLGNGSIRKISTFDDVHLPYLPCTFSFHIYNV